MKLSVPNLPAVSPSCPPLLLRPALFRSPQPCPAYLGASISYSNSFPRASFDDESSTSFATEQVDDTVAAGTDSPIETEAANEQVKEFLDNLNIKVDSDDIYSLLLVGGGAAVALWLAFAAVGAIDSIPVFPKLMEVVGLGFTFWFTTRYLLFKKNRGELYAKIEELKQQVLG